MILKVPEYKKIKKLKESNNTVLFVERVFNLKNKVKNIKIIKNKNNGR